MKTRIIGTACTAVGATMLQVAFRSCETFVRLGQIVVHRCHSSRELYQSRVLSTRTVQQTSTQQHAAQHVPQLVHETLSLFQETRQSYPCHQGLHSPL